MYGSGQVIRRRAGQLREQGADVRLAADRLVAAADAADWHGRAADSLRERVRQRAARLRDGADRHEAAAESLERHAVETDQRRDTIADLERRAAALVADHGPSGVELPPSGHRDWLDLDLQELRR